jgi:LPS export ABC transporter protein LptC
MFRFIPFLFVAAFFLAMLPACVNDPAKVNSITQKNLPPTESAHSIDMLWTDSAKLKVHMTAPQVEMYDGNNPYTEMKDGVRLEFFNDSLNPTVDSYLTANYGIYRQHDQLMEAKRQVVVVNIKGEKLETEHLIYDQSKHRIRTDAAVRITTADQIIFGTGLDSDETFTDYEIKNISGTITLHDQPTEPTEK